MIIPKTNQHRIFKTRLQVRWFKVEKCRSPTKMPKRYQKTCTMQVASNFTQVLVDCDFSFEFLYVPLDQNGAVLTLEKPVDSTFVRFYGFLTNFGVEL